MRSFQKMALTRGGGSGGNPRIPGVVEADDVYIPSGRAGSGLTDFPLRIDLAQMPPSFWEDTNDGGDLRFFNKDDNAELPTDLVYCDTVNEEGAIFVKVPTVFANDNTILYWKADGSSSRPAADAANGSEAVWSDYEYVGIPYADYEDRTANANTLTENGTITYGAPTGVRPEFAGGGMADLDQSDAQYLSIAVADPLGQFTMGISFLTGNNTQDALCQVHTGSDRAGITNNNGNAMSIWDNNNSWLNSGFNANNTDWSRVNGRYNDDVERNVQANQNRKSTDTTVTSQAAKGFDTFKIGAIWDGTSRFFGQLGWCYLRAEYLSDEWVDLEQEMMANLVFARVGGIDPAEIESNVDLDLGDLTNWSDVNGNMSVTSSTSRGSITLTSPFGGNFFINTTDTTQAISSIDGDVSSLATAIDNDKVVFECHFALGKDFQGGSQSDTAQLEVFFLDDMDATISSYDSGTLNVAADTWEEKTFSARVPANTRTIRITATLRHNGLGSGSNGLVAIRDANVFDFSAP